jgi:hypothetical protein
MKTFALFTVALLAVAVVVDAQAASSRQDQALDTLALDTQAVPSVTVGAPGGDAIRSSGTYGGYGGYGAGGYGGYGAQQQETLPKTTSREAPTVIPTTMGSPSPAPRSSAAGATAGVFSLMAAGVAALALF